MACGQVCRDAQMVICFSPGQAPEVHFHPSSVGRLSEWMKGKPFRFAVWWEESVSLQEYSGMYQTLTSQA